MSYNVIKGDLIELAKNNKFDIIVHGCNCFHVMGGGIAYQIKSEFPSAYEADKKTIKGSKDKLGKYSYVKIDKLTIINAYTQYGYEMHNRGSDDDVYNAIKKVFETINNNFMGKNIGIPMIGAGLARCDWNIIEKIIKNTNKNNNITLVLWDKI
jgi:O-acetyl-ADP-ribose deacetylase (regulator of RNase III)